MSEELKIIANEDGTFSEYDDTFDITIHCQSEEEQNEVLEKLNATQPKMGRWIEHFDESGKWYECDQCHTDWGGSVNYCPNCGAKMWEIPTGAEGSEKE